ncbi:MAG TPA: hypothetical protein VHA78_02675 [Candidatus Peribacteraceae bacterium]|nr:hypothetical protein [Candidatus Peribacteraceae bacterium]
MSTNSAMDQQYQEPIEVTILQESSDDVLDAASSLETRRALGLLMEIWPNELPADTDSLTALAKKSRAKLSKPVDTPSLLQVVSADADLMRETAVREFVLNIQRHTQKTREGLMDVAREIDGLYSDIKV